MNIFSFIYKFIIENKENLDTYYYDSKYVVSTSSLKKISSKISFKNTYIDYIISNNINNTSYYPGHGTIRVPSLLEEYGYVPDLKPEDLFCKMDILREFDSEYISLCFEKIMKIEAPDSDDIRLKNRIRPVSILDFVMFDYYPNDNIVIIKINPNRSHKRAYVRLRSAASSNKNVYDFIEKNSDEMIIDLEKAEEEFIINILSFEGSSSSDFFDMFFEIISE